MDHPTEKPVAIVDMGTNTFHLLIASGRMFSPANILLNQKIAVKLGKGGISQSIISEEAQNRAMKALAAFRHTLSNFNPIPAIERTIATSALRSAKNSDEFLERVKRETGFIPQVISGDEEAEFIYLGVRSGMQLQKALQLIMDIGGGSVEFIIASDEKILWQRSFEIGAQRLKDKFHHSEPILQEELNSMDKFLNQELSPLSKAIAKFNPRILIGVSGTFDTLSEIFELRYGSPGSVENPADGKFELQHFEPLRKELTKKDLEARLNTPGMIEFRAEMIVVALSLIQWVLNQNPFEKLRISKYALKEGVLYSIMNQENP